MNKFHFFKFLYGFIIGLFIGFIIYPYLAPKTPIEIPMVKYKEKTITDTLTAWEFEIIEIKDTLYKESPFIWKLWKYQDSLLKVQFEADTFRNFEYEIFQKEKVIFKSIPGGPRKEKYGEVFAGITFSNIHIGLSYKFLSFFIQYNFKNKNFIPGVGVRWQF